MSLFALAVFFFFQAEDGIRDLVRSRGLGDVYKRQVRAIALADEKIVALLDGEPRKVIVVPGRMVNIVPVSYTHLTLPTSDLV